MPMPAQGIPIPVSDLKDLYGLMGPEPRPRKSKPTPKSKPAHVEPRESTRSQPSSSRPIFSLSRLLHRKARSAPSSDAGTLSRRTSMDSQRTLTSTTSTSSKPKDYEQAFGELSSKYGVGGGPMVQPTFPMRSTRSTPATPKPSRHSPETLGKLLTQYGTGSSLTPHSSRDSR